jgi:PAS domain S-box-containing protein
MTPGTLAGLDWLPGQALEEELQRLAERLHARSRRAPALGQRGGDVAVAASDLAAALTVAHDVLAEAGRPYADLVAFLPDAYLVTDPDGVILEANAAVSGLIGSARTYVRGKPLTALLQPAAVPAVLQQLQQLQQAPPAPRDRPRRFESQLRARRRGPPPTVRIWLAPLCDAAGTLVGWRWLLRDITTETAQAAQLAEVDAAHAQALRTRTMELEATVRLLQAELAALRAAAATMGAGIDGPPDQASSPLRPASGPPVVLVVDDDAGLTQLLEAVLVDEGYRCVIRSSLAAAVALLQAERVALIITDSFSPTSAEVLAATAPLVVAAGRTPVLLVTGHVLDEPAVRAAGFAGLLGKPFDLDVLLTHVTTLLAATPTP